MSALPWPCRTLGDPRNPPLVFLHGFLGRGDDFLPIAAELQKHFFCLLPDLPGHGENTTGNPERPLNFPLLAERFAVLTDIFRLEEYTLVGYSMGGRVALYLACRFPRRVRALVVESANPGLEGERERRARLAADRQRAARMEREGMAAFLEFWYALPLFASLQRRPHLRERIKTQRARNAPRWMGKIMVELSPASQPSLWDELSAMRQPTLLVSGALDSKYARLMQRMAKRMPQANLAIVEQAGHNVHLERPLAYTRRLEAWLRGRG